MPLQKSFSEQNGSSRTRYQRWNRSKSHTTANNAPSAPSRPLEPVSDVTKNKLNAFNFCPKQSDTKDTSDEPATAAGESFAATTANTSTPAGRLAWKDLIGKPDVRNQEDDASPNERLLWDTSRNGSTYNLSPMMPRRRGKKRARSSSPTSSPNTPAVNVKKLSQALKSPYADPALQLWDRFSVSGSASATPMSATNPKLAQIMVSSSPQPSKVLNAPAHQEGGLRRAISCGANWPKRRRGDRQDSAVTPMDVVVDESPSNASKSSMVSALLESVDGEIKKSKVVEARQAAMRSPSPKKRQVGHSSSLGASPSSRRHIAPKPSPSPLFPNPGASRRGSPMKLDKTSADSTSDYGDDDFDDEILMELDANCRTSTMAEIPPISQPSVQETSQMEDTPCRKRPCPGPIQSNDDEFADFDDDVFAAAAENLLTGGNTGQSIQTAQTHPQPQGSLQGEVVGVGTAEPEEDPYGDDFDADLDLDAVELAATQSAEKKRGLLPSPSDKPRAIQRYLVTTVLESHFTDGNGREMPEKILFVKVDRSEATRTIRLRDDWVDTPVSPKAYVHIIGVFHASGQCIVDNSQNILILHPDQLVSATVVADSFTCMRRAVLQDRVKATSEKTPPLVYGTLLHEIFQETLLANKWDLEFLDGIICRITEKHVEDLYAIKVPIPDAREHLRSKMTELKHWAAAFVAPFPRPDAVVHGRNGDKANMSVTKLLDVEEHVWSPMYGMKGNIDATVQVTMKDGSQRRTLTVPFEVKTGKNATSNHQAQTSLYNLLLSDRYDIEIAYGILYYMETSQTIRIPTIRNELRHMIMQRNSLACYVRERSVQLPPMKRSTNTCAKCYAKDSCFIYHRLADNGDGETSGMKGKFDEVIKHLTPTHQEFFLKWEDLLTKEERESQKLRRELWTMLSTERERVGRCFANVIIEEGSASEDTESPKINRYRYNFVKANPGPDFSFLDSQLAVGEPIVISDEQGHFALALGFVTSVRKQRISVAVDRRLHNARIRRPGFDEEKNQVFASIMEVVPEGATPAQSQGRIQEAPVQYRLDKDEFSNGMATVRNNLVQVMTDSLFGSRKIRQLVVDLQPPTFKSTTTQYTISDSESLNIDQKKAIEKVMSANDYALVLGMPGTGKTTTIAHIIRALARQGKSVLLTSYTHSAVDNILLKLKNDGTRVLRLGAPAKVHPEVQEFAVLAGQPLDNFEEIRQAWHETPIVATTCLGVNHPVFHERTFDYCIVDEASQITLPICLGPIRMAQTFVLVGDHNQLPPLVQNEEARTGGLDISLFKLLSDTHPDSVVNLEHQYRMCEDVMVLSNTLIYEGRLKCGTEALRHRRLEIPNMEALREKHYHPGTTPSSTMPRSICTDWKLDACWLRHLIDPENRVRFINTDALPNSREEAKGNRIVNPTEAQIVGQLVDALVAVGVPESEIGVMTHYRSQLSLLKDVLRRHGNNIELHTADRFQGRDKEVVVLSLVRSNEGCNIGELLKDWRRINVAFTRSKTKLLVVGSRDTLKGSGDKEMVSKFVRLMEERDWVYDLGSDALDKHCFRDTVSTQVTASYSNANVSSPPRDKSKPNRRKGPASPCSGGGNRAGGGGGGGKENQPPGRGGVRRAKVTEKALLQGRPILRDIMHDIVG